MNDSSQFSQNFVKLLTNPWLGTYVVIFTILLLVGCNNGPEQLEGISSVKLESNWQLRELAWSPNGRYIAATVDAYREDQAIYIIELETKSYYSIQAFSDRISYEADGAEWSPDNNSLILYYPAATVGPAGRPEKLTPFDIIIIDAQTTDILQEVREGSYSTWGRTQDEVIVVDSDIGRLQQAVPIYKVNLPTNEATEIARARADMIFVSEGLDVSATGLLVYRVIEGLQIINIDNGDQVGEIKSDNRLISPTWSPDGEILAYIEDLSVPGQSISRNVIYLTTPDGSCRSEPLDTGSLVRSLDWSPDGQQLVFSTPEKGKLFFIDLSLGVGKELIDSFKGNCGL